MRDIPRQFDEFQLHHKPLAFVVAVVKGYSEDKGGRHAALITYYLFMSLFPLLLLLSLFSNWINQYFPGISNTIIHGATNYFPVLGQELYKIAHGAHRSASSLAVPALVALYGARGTAMTFRTIVNDLWDIPKKERDGFPQSWIKGIGIVLLGGGGFVFTAALTSWALGQGHGNLFRVVMALVSVLMIAGVFLLILRLSLPKRIHIRQLYSGAAAMSIALSMLQLVGGFIVTHDLKHYTDTYTALFGTTIGLLAWIYLEAQIILYSIETTVVVDRHSWPRRLISE